MLNIVRSSIFSVVAVLAFAFTACGEASAFVDDFDAVDDVEAEGELGNNVVYEFKSSQGTCSYFDAVTSSQVTVPVSARRYFDSRTARHAVSSGARPAEYFSGRPVDFNLNLFGTSAAAQLVLKTIFPGGGSKLVSYKERRSGQTYTQTFVTEGPIGQTFSEVRVDPTAFRFVVLDKYELVPEALNQLGLPYTQSASGVFEHRYVYTVVRPNGRCEVEVTALRRTTSNEQG